MIYTILTSALYNILLAPPTASTTTGRTACVDRAKQLDDNDNDHDNDNDNNDKQY